MSGGPDDAVDVLYVDSDPADVLMVQESMVQADAPVGPHIAPDGNQALRFVRRAGAFRSAPRPRLILLELHLADIPGLGVLAELKADPDLMTIPVIIFSSSRDPVHIRRSYALHADAYIAKPGDFDGFAEAIRQLLGSYTSLIRAPPGALGGCSTGNFDEPTVITLAAPVTVPGCRSWLLAARFGVADHPGTCLWSAPGRRLGGTSPGFPCSRPIRVGRS